MTASPNSPVDKIPPESLRAKLPAENLRATRIETDAGSPQRARLQLWLHRMLTLLFVFFCAVLGVLLVVLPWRPEWTDNHFLLRSPGLRALVSHGFVRGLCSGLGLLDIWIGFCEAVHYNDIR